jgi:HEPN domain-containing protein
MARSPAVPLGSTAGLLRGPEVAVGGYERYDDPGAVNDDGAVSAAAVASMNQALLQKMVLERIKDAKVLLKGKRWAYAYYVSGYAVECGLKSCVLAQMIHTGGIFKDKKYAEWCWTHDFKRLIELADLKNELDKHEAANKAFRGHWGVAGLWNETSRYEERTQDEAEKLYEAITDDPDGVLKWIQNYW